MLQGVRGVWEALLFWLLAGYGAMSLVWHVARRLQRRLQRPRPLTLVLVVQNSQDQIEGILRTLMVRTAFGIRERHIIVFDAGSTDDTSIIVQRLCEHHHCLSYVRVAEESHWLDELSKLCVQPHYMSCVYDLRNPDQWTDVVDDLQWLCQ
jgi:hypothetical protein